MFLIVWTTYILICKMPWLGIPNLYTWTWLAKLVKGISSLKLHVYSNNVYHCNLTCTSVDKSFIRQYWFCSDNQCTFVCIHLVHIIKGPTNQDILNQEKYTLLKANHRIFKEQIHIPLITTEILLITNIIDICFSSHIDLMKQQKLQRTIFKGRKI